MSSLTISVLRYALDGLGVAEKAASNNIANDQTPDYTAETVSFEPALAAALGQGHGTVHASVTIGLSAAPAGTDGNNVDLTTAMTGLQEDTLQYQALSSALNAKFRILSAAEAQA